ncbi:hypothetical protein DEU56DRAFT_822666 [Suillus clintonianus]|uniref:uncharacterized protein n=1 Tax=Suillus clintonianus TaxID=1904413 RepID=UPI001B87DBD7|nr:uncharacterized protein DEU56DRAFT_822666 [Suillus clintonianus]KAG2126296.1 hypothetical protein DEU56DRAFT_822666 [Suillus clintonianus]
MSNLEVLAYDSRAFAHAAYNVWVTRICQLCPCIIFLYDYFLTLDREVEFIWRRPMRSSSVLYIIVRFGGGALVFLTAAAFTSERTSLEVCFCSVFLRIQGWPSFCVLWAVQLILQLRVYALYRRSQAVLIAMAVGFTAEVIAMSIILGIGMAETTNSNEPMPGTRICAVTQAPPALAYVWLPDIVFGAFLFVLAARIGFKRGRFGFDIFRMERKDLVDALVYGNVKYFFCILAANAVNAGIWQGLGFNWFEAPEGFAAVIEIVLGCRMVLDLKSAVSDSEGLHLLDSFPLRDSFGAREGPSTLYSAVSTYDLEVLKGQHRLTQEIEVASPTSCTSGESSRALIEGQNQTCNSPLPTIV